MQKVKLLDSVKINGRHFDPEISLILWIARLTAPTTIDNTVWVTSAADGKHSQGSRHYTNEAFDIRVRNIKGFKWGVKSPIIQTWAERMQELLGPSYDVVYGDPKHLDHIHIEWDPK